ncbi:MAG: YVTN family beta-propeller protein, partial [Myxococcota bacterium]
MRSPFIASTVIAATVVGAAGATQTPTTEFLSINGVSDADGVVAQAWSPDGSVLLVVHEVTGDVTFLDPSLRTRVSVGAGPLDIEVCPVNGLALVPDSLDDTLSVIDVGAATVIATIPLSGTLPYQVEIASTGAFAVVACADSDSVSVVDLVSLTEIATFRAMDLGPVRSTPRERARYPKMDLGPDDRTLAIPGQHGVGVFDVTTGSILAEMTVPSWQDTMAVAIGPSSRHVAFLLRDTLYSGIPGVIDLATGTTQATCFYYFYCPVEVSPESLAVSADAEIGIVASADGELVFFDLETAETLANVACAGNNIGMSPDGRTLFTSGPSYALGASGMSVVDVTRMECLATLEGVTRADQISVHPSGRRIASLSWLEAERSEWFEYTPLGLVQVASVPTGAPPEGDGPRMVACDATARHVVTANSRSGTVTILERETGERHIVETGGAWRVAMDDAGTVAVVSQLEDKPLGVIDLAIGRVVAEIDCGQVTRMTVSDDGKRLYVTDTFADELHVVALARENSRRIATLRVSDYYAHPGSTLAVSRDDIVAVRRFGSPRSLTLIDGVNARILVDLPQSGAGALMFSPDGQFLFAGTGSSVSKIRVDGEDSSPVDSVDTYGSPQALLVSRDGRFLYVESHGRGLVVVATDTMTVTSELDVEGTIEEMAQVGRDLFLRITNVPDIQRVRLGPEGQATSLAPLIGSGFSLDLHATPAGILFSVPALR